MGLFSKPKPKEQPPGEDFDPVVAAAVLLQGTGTPGFSLGLLMLMLLQNEIVTPQELERLGISEEELVSVFSAFREGNSVEEINYDLEVRAAIRRYDQELALLALRRGIEPDTPAYAELRSVVAQFAHDNQLTNISAAYRLMLAECPDKLPGQAAS
jgi:hypothetical protein